MATYTKARLVAELAKHAEVTQKKIGEILDKLTEITYREADDGVTIPGICRVDVVNRNERRARNPHTGEALLIPAHRMVRVRTLKRLRDNVSPPPKSQVISEEPQTPAFEPATGYEEAAYAGAPPQAPAQPAAQEEAVAYRESPAPAARTTEPLISFRCKNTECLQEIEAPVDMAGEAAECPACGFGIDVPYFSEPGTLHGPAIEEDTSHSRTIRIELPDDDPFE